MFYSFACLGVRFLLRLLTRCSVVGLENVPSSGSFLLISNHLNLIDPPVLGALLPRRITFMAKEELFPVPIIGWMVKWYGAFPVRRGQADRQALRNATDVLQRGGVVGMFPEGTRSKTGKLKEAYAGASLVAVMADSPILPVAITGTDQVRSLFSLLSRPKITITVGRPFTVGRARSGKGGLESATRAMMGNVAALLPADRRGVYADVAEEMGGTRAFQQ